ncbi:MAG: hypothetical protein AB1486_27690 [Planctomycetota bacterium]
MRCCGRTAFVLGLLSMPAPEVGFAQQVVLLRRHGFLPEQGQTELGYHTIIDIGDVGNPSVSGDGRDGFHDYAILNDIQECVVVCDGRTGAEQVVPAPSPSDFDWAGFGACGDGGKDIVGAAGIEDPVPDGVPDFVVGAPRCNLLDGQEQGEIWVVNGDNLQNLTRWRKWPSDPDSLWFGRAVHLMRDYTDDGFAEILVGSDSYFSVVMPGGYGRAFVIDAHVSGTALAQINPPIDPEQGKRPGRFSYTLDFLGDLLRDRAGNETKSEFGPEGYVLREDEIVVGDPIYDVGTATHAGFRGLYRGKDFQWLLVEDDDFPNAALYGTQQDEHLGNYVLALGDGDAGRHQEGGTLRWHTSWDPANGIDDEEVTVWPAGAAGDHVFLAEYHLVPGAGVCLFPYFRDGTHNNQFTPPQVTDVGDVDLDGHDDFAVVVGYLNGEQEVVGHGVRIYHGSTCSLLWEKNQIDGKPFLGTPAQHAVDRRTSVNRLGDVSGDGADDWGIVTGVDDNDDGTPDRAVALLYGILIGPLEIPPPVRPGKPRLGGAKIVEIGRELFILISNGVKGEEVYLYRDTQLLDPPVVECDGKRYVGGTPLGPFTFDDNGEVFYFEPVSYDPARIGETIYFQAYAPYGGADCSLSGVRNVVLRDLTDPDRF